MIPVHPGRVLRRELRTRDLSANRLAIELKLPSGRITDILNGKRGISPDTALRLGRFFGVSARFWLNLQTGYELAVAELEIGARINDEIKPAPVAA
jgi:antitoxin HigA-1